MAWALMIWTVTAMAGDRFYQHKHYDWQQLAVIEGQGLGVQACHQAARELGLKEYRCIKIK